MQHHVSHLRPDGTTFPPVTPDPPPPPGYEPPPEIDPSEQRPTEDDPEPAPATGSRSGSQEPSD